MTCFVSSVVQRGLSFYRDHFREMTPLLLILAVIQSIVYAQLFSDIQESHHLVFLILFNVATLIVGAVAVIYFFKSVDQGRGLKTADLSVDVKKSLFHVTASLFFVIIAFIVVLSLGALAIVALSGVLSWFLPFKLGSIFFSCLILLIFPLVLSFRFFLAPFIAYHGDTNSFGLKESWRLTKCNAFPIVVLVLGVTGIELALGAGIDWLSGGKSMLTAIAQGFLDGLVFMPLLMILASFLYKDLLAKKG